MFRLKTLCALLAGIASLPVHALETAYLTPSAAGVEFTPIMNVGDAAGRYPFVGVPDGLGTFDNGNGSFTVLINHELRTDKGIARDHGSQGAFVSRWVINKADLRVLYGMDLVNKPENVLTWNTASADWVAGTTSIGRLCSADLPRASAFKYGPLGYNGRIFMNGEENSDEGRAFAWIATGEEAGKVYELPYLGKFNWENSVASPFAQEKTIVMGQDDDGSTDSGQYVYVGTKQATGNAVERAGLHNGKLYGIKVGLSSTVPLIEDANTAFGAGKTRWSFTMVDLGDVSARTGAQLEADSLASGVSMFRRVEDGAWDTKNARRFYFVTTADMTTKSRLWRMTFKDITNPEQGGTIELLLDGGDGVNEVRMMDNLTVDGDGHVIIQEDPGNNAYLAKVWKYDPASRSLTQLAEHDAARFGDASEGTVSDYHTQDEESSGVVEVTNLFNNVDGYDTLNNRYYLLVTQAHAALHPDWSADQITELVEGGQLMLMKVAK